VQQIVDEIKKLNFDFIFDDHIDTENKWGQFKQIVNSVIDKIAPLKEFKVKDKAALNEELAKCTMYEDPTLELVNILINTLSEERAAILINTKLSILKHCDTIDITYELAKDPAVHSV
jgi:hypothetical protein